MNRTLCKGLFLLSLVFLQACGSGDGSSSGGGSGGGGNVASSPSTMKSGDVVYLDLSNGSGSVELPASGSFSVLLQSHDTGGTTNTYTLSSLSSTGKSLGLSDVESDFTMADPLLSHQDLLDSVLRDEENYTVSESFAAKSLSSSGSASKSADSGVSAAVSKDATGTFYVLDSLTDTTDCTSITATAKYVGTNVCIYVDNQILSSNPSDLSQSDIDTLGAIYDSQFTDVTGWLGGVSDINNDGCVVALIAAHVNKELGGSGGGIVTGYFNSSDLSSGTCSNEREIVYMLSPDSGGIYGTKVSNKFYMSNFAKAVFPHELTHLIVHHQKVVLLGAPAETSCLNEGLAHIMEDRVGYNVENPSRYDLFLNSPQSYSACGSTSLAGRGATYLFLRYLCEQSGACNTFLKNLVQSAQTGYNNIVQAYPKKTSDFDEIGEFFRQWACALGYTDSGVSTGSQCKYQERTQNPTTGNWEGVCLVCKPGDNRSTVLTGPAYGTFTAGASYSLRDASTRFLNIAGNPSKITISAPRGAKGYAVIIRTD